MSLSDLMVRISQIEMLTASVAAPTLPRPAVAVSTGASFAETLTNATLQQTQYADNPGGPAGARVLSAAQSQIGVMEQPPGSNDSPEIAVYRSAVAGAQAGQPWCAYFTSWAAAQAGTPVGDNGAGIGSVAGITDWAAQNGRLLPASATPAPGDLILFGTRHIGIVESVNPDGSIETVEGNHGSAVERVHRAAGSATGFVRLG